MNIYLVDFRVITSRTGVLLNQAGSLGGAWKTSTAPQGDGRWSGRMNPLHRTSSTRLGLGAHEVPKVVV
jgi:hypothetical protein